MLGDTSGTTLASLANDDWKAGEERQIRRLRPVFLRAKIVRLRLVGTTLRWGRRRRSRSGGQEGSGSRSRNGGGVGDTKRGGSESGVGVGVGHREGWGCFCRWCLLGFTLLKVILDEGKREKRVSPMRRLRGGVVGRWYIGAGFKRNAIGFRRAIVMMSLDVRGLVRER